MKKIMVRLVVAFVILGFYSIPYKGSNAGVQAQGPLLPTLESSLSADGLTLHNGVPPLMVVVDHNPAMAGIKVPTAPDIEAAIADPNAANAAFSFNFMAAGGTDPWGAVCQTFPEQAKTAFTAAAAIWTSTIQSSVPIAISACWSNLGSTDTLGYSGSATSYRDFSGAPKPNTWYESSLANALHGSDLDAIEYDDYITYNSGYTWYFGTDGLPTAGTFDLVTIAAHEIAHGLNFSGMTSYSGGTGTYGNGSGFPNVYDTFMENSGGTKLTNFTNPSASLGSLLTSDALWFNGANANAANGGSRVRIYAPSTWSLGSSYGHLDYSVFAGTQNSMMVYAVGPGSSQHNPGPVTKGIMKDLGWILTGVPVVTKIYLPLVIRAVPPPGSFNKTAPTNGATGQSTSPTLSWGASSDASGYQYCIGTSACTAGSTWTSTTLNTSVPLSGLAANTTYYWQVRANNSAGTAYADGGTSWSFTTTAASGTPWTTILSETFEGSFPGSWQLFPSAGYQWGQRNCKAYAGSFSGWGVGGGSGSSLSCGANYPNDVNSWMVYGPFNLADATAADLLFQLWQNSEPTNDKTCAYASIDNNNYYGNCWWGDLVDWTLVGLELSNVFTLGNLTGQPNVWIALTFESNASITFAEGGHVDNIVLRKCTAALCAAGTAAVNSGNSKLIAVPSAVTRPK